MCGGGGMTATLNSNGDVCAIQKAGGEGVLQGVIMHCLRIAAAKAGAISDMIKKEVRYELQYVKYFFLIISEMVSFPKYVL